MPRMSLHKRRRHEKKMKARAQDQARAAAIAKALNNHVLEIVFADLARFAQSLLDIAAAMKAVQRSAVRRRLEEPALRSRPTSKDGSSGGSQTGERIW